MHNEETIVSSINCGGKTDIHIEENEIIHFSNITYKNQNELKASVLKL